MRFGVAFFTLLAFIADSAWAQIDKDARQIGDAYNTGAKILHTEVEAFARNTRAGNGIVTSTLSVCNRGQCASSSFQLSDPNGGTWADHTGITELQFSPEGTTLYFQVLAPPDPKEVVHMFTMPTGPDVKVIAADAFTVILKGPYTGLLAVNTSGKIAVIDPRARQKVADASIADFKNWQGLVEQRREAAERR